MEQFLNLEQIDFYNENGYLVVEKFLDDNSIAILKERTKEIITAFDPKELKVFTTENQESHMDDYFLGSGDKVRCFFEEGAIDKNGVLAVSKEKSINKVGHAMHDLIPDFEKIAYTPALYSIAKSLGLKQASIVQSQYIFKQPKIGAKVNPHTDSTFIYTDPLSCLGVWIALEDAEIENGCLSVIAGSHQISLKDRFVRNKANTGTEFVNMGGDSEDWNLQKLEALPVRKGDMVLLHGQVVHASFANRSKKSRHAFVLHLIDLDCEWPTDNWLQRSETLPFRVMENVVYHRFG